MDRRRFLTRSAALAAATFQTDALLRAQRASDSATGRAADTVARDEDFWFNVRHAFTVDRNMINLNNGGVSPAPKIVMDTEIRYLEIENLNPSYYMWNVLDPGVETGAAQAGRDVRLRSRRNRHYPQRERRPGDRPAWHGPKAGRRSAHHQSGSVILA